MKPFNGGNQDHNAERRDVPSPDKSKFWVNILLASVSQRLRRKEPFVKKFASLANWGSVVAFFAAGSQLCLKKHHVQCWRTSLKAQGFITIKIYCIAYRRGKVTSLWEKLIPSLIFAGWKLSMKFNVTWFFNAHSAFVIINFSIPILKSTLTKLVNI